MNDANADWPLWIADQDAAGRTTSQEHGALALAGPCPICSKSVGPTQRFCENCGADVHPEVTSPAPQARPDESTVKLNRVRSAPRACLECGGAVDADGYCQTCGAKAPSERDHFEDAPAPWVAGVCDRGLTHPRNEDAMALWADDATRTAVIVVCDGVTSSADSDQASMAAAQAARDVLVAAVAAAPVDADLTDALERAARAANDAVVALPAPPGAIAGSCTFAAAVVRGPRVDWANLGDSRLYAFVGDSAAQLSTDDSVAEELIRAGSSRLEAESGPQAHAITRWLGPDAEDVTPGTGTFTAPGDGWLLVCTDGLWNYASEPSELAAVFAELEADATDPTALGRALVAWANTRGGRDNITVALARLAANLKDASPVPAVQTPNDNEAPETKSLVEEKI